MKVKNSFGLVPYDSFHYFNIDLSGLFVKRGKTATALLFAVEEGGRWPRVAGFFFF